jgi:hypothetical protein
MITCSSSTQMHASAVARAIMRCVSWGDSERHTIAPCSSVRDMASASLGTAAPLAALLAAAACTLRSAAVGLLVELSMPRTCIICGGGGGGVGGGG